jgi:hypothetical protein
VAREGGRVGAAVLSSWQHAAWKAGSARKKIPPAIFPRTHTETP